MYSSNMYQSIEDLAELFYDCCGPRLSAIIFTDLGVGHPSDNIVYCDRWDICTSDTDKSGTFC